MRMFLTYLLLFFSFASASSAVLADSPLPEGRFVLQRDTDHFGADLGPLFDTDMASCARACSGQQACVGFVFNSRSDACFPKSSMTESAPFEGAFSAQLIRAGKAEQRQAEQRAARLTGLDPADFTAARQQAAGLGLRFPAGGATVEDLAAAAAEASPAVALRWIAEAVAISDRGDLWQAYARSLMRQESKGTALRRTREAALSAALNSYFRAQGNGAQAQALMVAARALEQLERGRAAVSVLRVANDLAPSPRLAERLDKAIAAYGFRVTDSSVESDSAAPRICVTFSEELRKLGVNYDDYVKLPDPRLVADADGHQLCIDGVVHGTRYQLTLRRGLPAATGEVLNKDVTLTHYVRDRSPAVRFSGRSYVLPKGDQVALPVETVNATQLDLRLRRVSDRNLLRTLQEDFFARPLSQWQEEQFTADIAEEIWTGTADVGQDLNQAVTTRLPLGEALVGQPVGIYALSAQLPGADPYDTPAATQWFVLTDLGLSSMMGRDGLHVQVQSLSDARPRAGVSVQLVSNANAILGRTVTDEQGYARFAPGLVRGTGAAAPAVVMAEVGPEVDTAGGVADFAFLSLRDAAFDLSDRGVEGRAAPGPVDVFLFTDRGAYRAGEVIHATALARDPRAQALPEVPLIAVLRRPDGVEYSRQISERGQIGGHVFSLPVAATAPRGTWRLSILADPDGKPLASQQVLVEDFLPERIDFTQEVADAGQLRPGGVLQLSINARYLFGAPGSDLSIEGEVRLRAAEGLAGWPGYRFGRHDDRLPPQSRFFSGQTTDGAGLAEIDLSLPQLETLGQPLLAEVVTRLSDGSARPVERRLKLPVPASEPLIGIKPLFEDVVPDGQDARFQLIAIPGPEEAATLKATWTLNRIETRYQWYQLYGNWNWEPTTRRTRVATGEITLGRDPLELAQPVEWGEYELVVEHEGQSYVASSSLFHAGWYVPADGADTPDRLDVSLDRESYQPGDAARLRLNARNGGMAMISVVSDRLISRQLIEVSAGETLIPLTVTEEWGSGAYVTAALVQPLQGKADQTPVRALGVVHAVVERPGQKLAVSIDVPDVARPRTTQLTRVTVEGARAGEDVWLTVAAVDLGILNLTGFRSPDPVGYFYGQRRLGVELRDLYGRLIETGNGALGMVRSGGDAGSGMQMQSPPPTQDLMAVFSGPLKVAADGTVDVPIDLPPFNGTVRLMAVAWTQSAVGQAEQDMLVRDPIVVSASAPRFLAPGDQSRILIDLTHADGPSGEVSVSARVLGDGLALGNLPSRVVLAEQGSQSLILPVAASAVGDPEIELALTGPDGATVVQRLRMPVRANDPEVAMSRRFVLAGGDSFDFSSDVFSGLRPGTARAMLSSGPLARFDVPGVLNSLDRYPYGCTEQVTSRALPLLYLSSVAQAAGVAQGDSVATQIDQAIEEVLTRQASNGGFGLWRAESGDFWLDAYVTDFLSRARSTGHAVPEKRMQQALDNLRNRVNYAADFDNGGEALAYGLLVLAREGEAAMGDLRYYADVKAEAFATPLAVAQLGAALASYGDQRRADRLFRQAGDMLRTQTPDVTLWRADYGSALRDRAGVLALVTEARSDVLSTDRLAQSLALDGRSLSTQESAWTLMAAQALVNRAEDSGLLVNGQPVDGPFVEVRDGGNAALPMSLSAASGRQIDITLTTIGVPEVPAPVGGTGYSIERSYYTLDGVPIEYAEHTVGDRFVTVLRIVPFEPVGARLMINDPLAAGVEIDNPSLLRSGDLSGLDWLELSTAQHTEFRSDRFLAAVDLRRGDRGDKAGIITLAYVARAVTPGMFHHPAASVEDMYRPEFRARTGTGRLLIR